MIPNLAAPLPVQQPAAVSQHIRGRRPASTQCMHGRSPRSAGDSSAWEAAAAAAAGAPAHHNGVAAAPANGRRPRGGPDAACAPASPKQLFEAPAPTDHVLPFPAAVARPGTASAAAAAAGPASPAASADGLRHTQSQDEPPSPAASQADVNGAPAKGSGTTRSSSAGSSIQPEVLERVSRARLEATLPLLAAGSHIAVRLDACRLMSRITRLSTQPGQ